MCELRDGGQSRGKSHLSDPVETMQLGRQKVNNKTPLSDRSQEIILGSILGDGSLKLHQPYRNARFSFRHSAVNQDYFYWKVAQLKEISATKDVWVQSGPDGWGGDKLRYQSAALEPLTDLYQLTHPHGQFRIRRKWLNRLSPLSLCVWWLDDGSLLNGKQGVLCTDEFPYEELLVIVRYMRKVWGLNPRIGRVATTGPRANQNRIWFRTREDLTKFLRIILPHMAVPSMLKKVLLLDRDPEVQQRWISEVSEATKIAEDLVRGAVVERKSSLARFRE
jgi:hypothetical protein